MPAATPLVIFGVVFLMFVINVRAGAVVRIGGALLAGAVASLAMTTALNWYAGTIRDSLPGSRAESSATVTIAGDGHNWTAPRAGCLAVLDVSNDPNSPPGPISWTCPKQ